MDEDLDEVGGRNRNPQQQQPRVGGAAMENSNAEMFRLNVWKIIDIVCRSPLLYLLHLFFNGSIFLMIWASSRSSQANRPIFDISDILFASDRFSMVEKVASVLPVEAKLLAITMHLSCKRYIVLQFSC